MKKLLSFIFLLSVLSVKAQITGTIVVRGDLDKFYPVTFLDGGYGSNAATELELGRSSTHTDASWRGSLMAAFRYHTTNWGNASQFINADIRQLKHDLVAQPFIAGWTDATAGNGITRIVIWLRGGTTTYYYKSNYTVDPLVYDGVQNPLPFQQTNGPAHSFKTEPDSYVNSAGAYFDGSIYSGRAGTNYFAGNVGIGTTSPAEKLAVNGNIVARKVTVTNNGWADFVFDNDYKLRTLQQVEEYIQQHRHLPDVPSARDIQQNGLDLGGNQATLLQKIEELTLYIIDQNKTIQTLADKNKALSNAASTQQSEIEALKKQMKDLMLLIQSKP